MSNKYTVYGLALFAGLCAASLSFFTPFFPYGVDSANYIEQARSFIARGVFEVSPNYRMWGAGIIPVPDKLFPPGYPLLIVISSLLLQIPVDVIAPFLSLAALILLPIIIVFSFHRVLGLLPALWIAILVVLTPTAVRHGYIAYSDTLSLVLVIYCIHRLLVASIKPIDWFYLGLLTGISYLLRNANLGLLLSIGLYLLWRFLVEPENRKQKVINGFIWLGGNALIIVPLLIRNLFVFGKMQPYWMDPSSVSLSENIHDYLQAQLDTLIALSDLDKLLADELWGIILLFMLLAVLIHQVITTWQRWQKIEQQTFFIAVVYVLIGAAMVIVARTKYEWGVHINARYALPYSCFIFVALVIICKNTTFNINTRYFGLGLAVTLLITRVYELPKLYEHNWYYQYNKNNISVAKQINANKQAMCSYSDGRVIESDYAFVYRILCEKP
jgi:hypothetical protein